MRYIFILNPHAGRKKKSRALIDLIANQMKVSSHEYEFAFTTAAGDATRIASDAAKEGFDLVVAVGGDGTVNEVASGLVRTKGTLGIIPVGSGNGVARSLKIPLAVDENIKLLISPLISTIDVGKINDKYFIGIAGTGFDALIGSKFQEFGTRGPIPYFLIGIKEYLVYRPLTYQLKFDDDQIMEKKAIVIVFANTNEYGNGAIIAPDADPGDGLLDICIIDPLSVSKGVTLASMLFQGTLNKSPFYTHKRCKSLIVTSQTKKMYWHRDGEPDNMTHKLDIVIEQQALKVCSPLAGK